MMSGYRIDRTRAQAMPIAPVLNQISRQPALLDDQRGPLQDRDGR
jgi:hypothetical protein